MAPPNAERAAPAGSGNGSLETDRHPGAIDSPDKASSSARQTHLGGALVDKYGHHLSESVLTAWSPTMQRIMGVRRAEGGAP